MAIHSLLSIASVVSNRRGIDYNLQLSILLKGARGVGKFTAVSLVSRHLGLHILEVRFVDSRTVFVELTSLLQRQVNCYDVIGENDVKTEGLLRARFENAVACSPCVLVLRHLEAFAQSTQATENRKGE